MRTNKAFMFNEEKIAEEIIRNGFEKGIIDYGKMYVVAKYFREKYDYGAVRLEREIIDFCKSVDPNFNPITQAEYIKKWVKSAMEYNLRKINDVYISKKDVAFLEEIENNQDRKLLFAVLVLAKAMKKSGTRRAQGEYKTSDNYYIRYSNLTDISKISGIKISKLQLADMLHRYSEYFTFYTPNKELIKVEFVDKADPEDIKIDSLEDVSEMYEKLFEKKEIVAICEICGKNFTKASNRQKYCKECGTETDREKAKERMRKSRSEK